MSFQYIPLSMLESVTADKENAAFPADYITGDHPRKHWRSTDGTGTLTIQCEALTSGFGLFGTNAETITWTLYDETGTTVMQGPSSIDLLGITTLEEFMLGESNAAKTGAFVIYDAFQTDKTRLVIEFGKSFADNVPVHCGIVWPGRVESISGCILYPVDDSYQDYSDVDQNQYNNGAAYIFQRETARTLQCHIETDPASIDANYKIFRRKIGPNCFPVRVCNIDGDWDFFARFQSAPRRTYKCFVMSSLEFTLKERL